MALHIKFDELILSLENAHNDVVAIQEESREVLGFLKETKIKEAINLSP
jgi:low affinity Fe/Cu permease